jgi:hypothetical protein
MVYCNAVANIVACSQEAVFGDSVTLLNTVIPLYEFDEITSFRKLLLFRSSCVYRIRKKILTCI